MSSDSRLVSVNGNGTAKKIWDTAWKLTLLLGVAGTILATFFTSQAVQDQKITEVVTRVNERKNVIDTVQTKMEELRKDGEQTKIIVVKISLAQEGIAKALEKQDQKIEDVLKALVKNPR